MEVSNQPDYRFYHVFLYPPGSSRNGSEPCGTSQIEVFGSKGRLRCRIFVPEKDLTSGYKESQFFVLLCREPDGEIINAGVLITDQSGEGQFAWEFSTGVPGGGIVMSGPVTYKFLVTTAQDGERLNSSEGSVLVEGIVTLNSEVRDKRVVGFKKEAKVGSPNCKNDTRNPLFEKVDPFHPPIPNTSWWRISIQPDLDNGAWQMGYCPRQKPHQAVF